jgi:hypothetical protein
MNNPTREIQFLSEDELWMVPAVRELERLLDELVAAWPASPWTRYKFEVVLIAAEQGRFAEAYAGVLWSRDRFNLWREALARRQPASAEVEPSLDDYLARVDAVRAAAGAVIAKLENPASPPAAPDL